VLKRGPKTTNSDYIRRTMVNISDNIFQTVVLEALAKHQHGFMFALSFYTIKFP